MPDYKSMYYQLFNAITDVIGILQKVQIDTEELYISSEKPNITDLYRHNAGSNSEDNL